MKAVAEVYVLNCVLLPSNVPVLWGGAAIVWPASITGGESGAGLRSN